MKRRAAGDPRAAASAPSGAARGALAVWTAIVVLVFALHTLGAEWLRDRAWGMHVYAFLHPLTCVAAAAGLIALCVWAWRTRADEAPVALRAAPPRLRTVWIHVAALPAVTALLWAARVRHTSLGDGNPLAFTIGSGQAFHPDSPLTFALLQGWHRLWAPLANGTDPAMFAARTIAAASAVAGGFFALVAWAIAGELARDPGGASHRPRTRVLLALVLCLQGYALLFFGYVEVYAFVALALALYAWLALRALRGASPLSACAGALALAVAFHLMAVLFIPTILAVALPAVTNPQTRRRALLELAALSAFGAVAVALLSGVGGGPNLLGHFLALARIAASGEGGGGMRQLFGAHHLENGFQALFLVGPLGAFAWLAGWARRPRGGLAIFAGLCGALALAGMFAVQDLRLGYARDWDLYAPPGVMLAIAALALWSPRMETAAPRPMPWPAIAALALGISLFHTVPWIAVNAARDRAFARLQSLPLGQGRTEMAVAFWLLHDGDQAGAAEWTARALEANPRNLAGWLLRADLAQRAGRFADEARALKRATLLRPREARFRARMLDALRRAGELEIAREEARLWLLDAGGDPDAARLAALLENDSGDAAWDSALARAVEMRERTPIR